MSIIDRHQPNVCQNKIQSGSQRQREPGRALEDEGGAHFGENPFDLLGQDEADGFEDQNRLQDTARDNDTPENDDAPEDDGVPKDDDAHEDEDLSDDEPLFQNLASQKLKGVAGPSRQIAKSKHRKKSPVSGDSLKDSL